MNKILLPIIMLSFCMMSCVKDDPYVEPETPEIPDSSLRGKLVLNEINGTGADSEKYIELYNLSDEAINLNGVTIYYNNVSSEPAITWTGTTENISAKGFLLLKGTKKGENPGHDLSSGLSGTQGIRVEIRDSENALIDTFQVPADANRSNTYARIPDGTGAWYFDTPSGTAGATNGTETTGKKPIVSVPEITNLKRSVDAPTPDDDVVISADVTADSETTIASVVLEWTLNGAKQSDINMTADGNTYSGTISKQASGSEISYTVSATNNKGGKVSQSGSYLVTNTEIDYSSLVLNEIDGNGKFIEIYNKGTVDIPLTGVTLYKNESGQWWTGPAGTSIGAGEYYTVAQAGGAEGADEYSGASGISPKQNLQFELKAPDNTIIDTFSRTNGGTLGDACNPDYGKAAPSGGGVYSFSRCPDGTGDFGLAVPSCNRANPATSEGEIGAE
jgi:hypothetical protein